MLMDQSRIANEQKSRRDGGYYTHIARIWEWEELVILKLFSLSD